MLQVTDSNGINTRRGRRSSPAKPKVAVNSAVSCEDDLHCCYCCSPVEQLSGLHPCRRPDLAQVDASTHLPTAARMEDGHLAISLPRYRPTVEA